MLATDDRVDRQDSHYLNEVRQNNDHLQYSCDASSNTFVIKGRKRALKEAYNRSLNVRHSYYCITGNELAKSYKPFVAPLQLQLGQYGGSCHIITNMEKEVIPAVRELSQAGAQIRHIDSTSLRRCVIYDDNVAYFSIVEEPIISREAVKNVEETEGEDLWIASTEPSVIQSAKRRFLSDWENAVAAVDRINELEHGKPIEITRIIKDNKEAVNLYKSLAGSIQHEALYLLPSARALMRTKHVGILDSLIKSAEQRQAKIKILCPVDSENHDIFEELKSYISNNNDDNIEFKISEPTKSTILIVDREHVFTSELRNNSIYDIHEALSFSTYSNSKPTVESYVTLFESLWKQKEFADKLEQSRKNLELANEKLKIHDKMQREFIDVAAHELRTPVQPIIGLTEVLKSKIKDKQQEELLSIIIRNAKRLRQLTQNILDVTKIESQSLHLKKEKLDVNEVIMSVLADYGSSSSCDNSEIKNNNNIQKVNNKDVKITFNSKGDFFVMADRSRLYQVFANLLNNALKFTKEGIISITVDGNNDLNESVVSIKDTGIGIDPEIMPRLFTKFATKPETGGTGLGLFISKAIVEAHGGKMWAENNANCKGSTFSFSLPAVYQ